MPTCVRCGKESDDLVMFVGGKLTESGMAKQVASPLVCHVCASALTSKELATRKVSTARRLLVGKVIKANKKKQRRSLKKADRRAR